MTIISPLPDNLTNGTTADATQVMANFNQIVSNTNSNAAHNGANTDITSLASGTTATTQAFSDSTTKLANDAFVKLCAPMSSVVTSQFDMTSNVTLANIPGLTETLVSGATYKFSAYLLTTTDAGGGIKLAMGGTATATTFGAQGTLLNGTAFATSGVQMTFGSVIAGATGIISIVEIKGAIVVNAGGTFTVQAAQNASDGTPSSVLVMSTLEVVRIA